jgi:hypothetical protein
MRNKALVATAGFGFVLAACIIGGTLAVGLWQFGSLRSQTTAQILDTAISVGTYVNEQRARRLELVSRDIAADASFAPQIIQLLGAREAAADTGDAAAIRNALDERRRSAALDAIALLDANGKLVAEIGATFLAEHVLGSLPFVIKSRAEKVQASAVLDDDARLPVATATPITQDAELKALLITGVRVPAELPRIMSGVAKAEFALIAIEPTGPSVVNSTLATKTAEQLSAAVENDRNRWVNAAPSNFEVPIDGRAWTARAVALQPGGRKGYLVALVPPAHTEALLQAVGAALMVAMMVALLLLAALLIIGWKRGVAPLVAIANLSERAMHGDFALELKPEGFALIRHLGNLLNYLLKELDRHRVPHGVPRRRATDTR